MTSYIRRPRQAVGILYILLYLSVFILYAIIQGDDPSWITAPKFTVSVILWFLLSLAVKVTMVMNRIIELLNLAAVVAFMSIGFTYYPMPGDSSAIVDFCYYIYIMGGSVCDFFDFFYESGAKRPEETP